MDENTPEQVVQNTIQANMANPHKHKEYARSLAKKIVTDLEDNGRLAAKPAKAPTSATAPRQLSPELLEAIASTLSSLGTLASMLNVHRLDRDERS